MKNKFSLILLLLFVLNFEGAVLAKGTTRAPALKPDGNPAINRQHKRHRHSRARYKTRTTTRTMTMTTGGGSMTTKAPGVGSSPPTQARPPIDVNKTGAPSPNKAAPGIKPPTVNIKPPTR